MSSDVLIAVRRPVDALPLTELDPELVEPDELRSADGSALRDLHGHLAQLGDDFVLVDTMYGPGCTVAEILRLVDQELPGLLDGVEPGDIALASGGIEVGPEQRFEAVTRGWISGQALAHNAELSVIDAELGPDPAPRPAAARPEPPSEDEVAERWLASMTPDRIRAALRGSDDPS